MTITEAKRIVREAGYSLKRERVSLREDEKELESLRERKPNRRVSETVHLPNSNAGQHIWFADTEAECNEDAEDDDDLRFLATKVRGYKKAAYPGHDRVVRFYSSEERFVATDDLATAKHLKRIPLFTLYRGNIRDLQNYDTGMEKCDEVFFLDFDDNECFEDWVRWMEIGEPGVFYTS